jgi:hypothetical protein
MQITCYIGMNSTVRLVHAVLDLIDDFVSEFRSRMIATQLIRSVAAIAAKYRAARRTGRGSQVASKMCLVLEETDHSSAWLERNERKRLARRLEPVRQALFLADAIIEKTFSSRRTFGRLPRYAMILGAHLQRAHSRRPFPPPK